MSTPWGDDLDVDDLDTYPYGDGEDDDLDGQDELSDDEESWAARQRRAHRIARDRRETRVRREIRARQQARAARSGRPPARGGSTAAAIRAVNLDAQVADASLRREIAALRKTSTWATYATVAGVAVNQVIESIGKPSNPYLLAALRGSPLLLLSPEKRGTGVAATLGDPRVVGGLALLGITFFGEQRGKTKLRVLGFPQLKKSTSGTFIAEVLASDGTVLTGQKIDWDTTDHNIATAAGGVVNAHNVGAVFVVVTANGLEERVPLVVVA